jgi:hypothetical protein
MKATEQLGLDGVGLRRALDRTLPAEIELDSSGRLTEIEASLVPLVTHLAEIAGDQQGARQQRSVFARLTVFDLGAPQDFQLPGDEDIGEFPS